MKNAKKIIILKMFFPNPIKSRASSGIPFIPVYRYTVKYYAIFHRKKTEPIPGKKSLNRLYRYKRFKTLSYRWKP